MSGLSEAKDKAQAMSGAGLLVVASMCLALLAAVLTACWLAVQGEDVPDGLDRVLNGLMVGVPALLAKSYRDAQKAREGEVQQVEVTNTTSQPVPTADVVEETEVTTGVLGDAPDEPPPLLEPSSLDLDAPALPLAEETPRTIAARPRRARRDGSPDPRV